MQKPMSKRKIGALVTACSLLVGTSQTVLAQSIDEKFPAIKLPASAPQSEAAQHFVRLNLVSVSAWTYKQKSAGATPSNAEVAAYANMLNETLALKIAAFEAALVMADPEPEEGKRRKVVVFHLHKNNDQLFKMVATKVPFNQIGDCLVLGVMPS